MGASYNGNIPDLQSGAVGSIPAVSKKGDTNWCTNGDTIGRSIMLGVF